MKLLKIVLGLAVLLGAVLTGLASSETAGAGKTRRRPLSQSTAPAAAKQPAAGTEGEGEPERQFEFVYQMEIPAVEPGAGPVEVFIPLAESDDHQTVLRRSIDADVEGEIRREELHGNAYWHASLEHTGGRPLPVTVRYSIVRKLFSRDPAAADPSVKPLADEVRRRYLSPNRLVPVAGPLIDRVLRDIPNQGELPHQKAKAIFDYVVDSIEYKKVGSGWGNGDTYWACSKKYGNCTDFHALFISLARASGIPASFEIGFPIPADRSEGEVGGYHCWVTFFLPGVGWIPIDASEAKKHPKRRELFFGTHPADRITFSRGRDLKLGSGHNSLPLNYFIYPHIEIAGSRAGRVKTSFSFRSPPAKS